MSSHHIVRENQEPALIIANGQSCNNELLFQLLEWSPFVVVLDGALERVLRLGFKFDVLLGDFDRINPDHPVFSNQSDIEIVQAPDQNKTDLEKAMDFLLARGHKTVNIVWATGLRMDHTFNNIITLAKYHPQLEAVMLDDYSRIYALPAVFEKYYHQGRVLSLFPVGEVDAITTKGLKYNLDHEKLWLPGRTGSSNEAAQTGMVSIRYQGGVLLMMECTD